jgi:hypothetical protein
MNQFVMGIRFGLLAIGLCVSVVAFADGDQCVGGGSPPCDPFVVTPPPEPDPTPPSCQELGTCDDFGIYGIFAQLAGSNLPINEKLIKVLKAGKCKSASEDCGAWGSKLTTPKGLPTTAGGTGTGFCQAASGGLLATATATCIGIINYEVNVEGCANVACPAI